MWNPTMFFAMMYPLLLTSRLSGCVYKKVCSLNFFTLTTNCCQDPAPIIRFYFFIYAIETHQSSVHRVLYANTIIVCPLTWISYLN
jgi:hypothetical protein